MINNNIGGDYYYLWWEATAMYLCMMKDIHCIIFDCDGTLVDTESIATRILLDLVRQAGYPITDDEYAAQFVGTSLPLILAYVEERLDQPLDQELIAQTYRSQSKAAFIAEAQAVPGMLDLVASLRIPYCVASNGPRSKMAVTLPATGYGQLFGSENTFSAYDIQRWKPDPALFVHAAHCLGVAAEHCLVVEDTIHGITAAIAAGMEVVGVRVEHQLHEVKALNTPIVADGHDLLSYMDQHYTLCHAPSSGG